MGRRTLFREKFPRDATGGEGLDVFGLLGKLLEQHNYARSKELPRRVFFLNQMRYRRIDHTRHADSS